MLKLQIRQNISKKTKQHQTGNEEVNLMISKPLRRRRTVHLAYMLTTAMILPDLIFYSKLVIELVRIKIQGSSINDVTKFWTILNIPTTYRHAF